MPHEHRSGQPIVIFNPGAVTVGLFPGAMIAPADAGRRVLTIMASGMCPLTVYPRSGSDAANESGIGLYPYSGSLTLNYEEDPDLVVAEWWACANSVKLAFLQVMQEVIR